MKMSDNGRARLIEREGFKTKAYRDTVGVWTIGVGHTSAAGAPQVTPGLAVSKEEVSAILARDLVQYEHAVESACHARLTQGQFDALVSLCFNIGTGGFRKSTVARQINAGNMRAAADAFLLWNKPAVIMGRRRSERAQFLAATPSAQIGAPVRFLDGGVANDESVTADYLRAAGSRTIAATDFLKNAAAVVGGADAADALAQAQSAAEQAREAWEGLSRGADMLEVVKSYGQLAAGVALTVLVAFVAWRVWRAAHGIEVARIEDAHAK